MENNEQKEITLPPELATTVIKLSKEITSFDSQNTFMAFTHILILLASLVLGAIYIMQYINDHNTAYYGTAMGTLAIFDIIAWIPFQIITCINNKQRKKNKELIRKIIEDELSRQNS